MTDFEALLKRAVDNNTVDDPIDSDRDEKAVRMINNLKSDINGICGVYYDAGLASEDIMVGLTVLVGEAIYGLCGNDRNAINHLLVDVISGIAQGIALQARKDQTKA